MRKSRYNTSATMILIILLLAGLSSISTAADTGASSMQSQFLSEVMRGNYQETELPPGTRIFRWDFSRLQVHTYTYKETAHTVFDPRSFLGKKPADDTEIMTTMEGNLIIKSQGDSTADVLLKDLKVSTKMTIAEVGPKTMEQQMPPWSMMQGMREDGSGSIEGNPQDVLVKMMFPLPTKVLKLGESVEVPIQMPFNAQGSMLIVKGHSRITLARYVRIGKRICAELEVDTDLSEVKVPSEIEGEYKFSQTGKSILYFDVVGRAFVSGTVARMIWFSMNAPMPQMKISGEDKIPRMPERADVSWKNDSITRVMMEE